MKTLRVLYSVLLVASLGLSFSLYYKYHLRDEELTQYQKLSQYSTKVIKELSAKLIQSQEELEQSLKDVEKFNKTIAALEKDNSTSKGELQALKTEREKLQSKIAKLIDQKATWEKNFLDLEAKFRSLEELKKAIKIVRREQITQRRLQKIAILKKLDEIALLQGNRGYLVRSGISTFESKAKVKVELEPLDKWSYKEVENK